MTSTWKVDGRGEGRGGFKIWHVFANSTVFKQQICCSFLRMVGVGVKKLVIFGGPIKWMTPKNRKTSYHVYCLFLIICQSLKQRPVLWKTWQQQPPLINQLNDVHMEELDSVQKFIEIQGRPLRTFFIYLHNHLSSFKSIFVQMSEKRDLSSRL